MPGSKPDSLAFRQAQRPEHSEASESVKATFATRGDAYGALVANSFDEVRADRPRTEARQTRSFLKGQVRGVGLPLKLQQRTCATGVQVGRDQIGRREGKLIVAWVWIREGRPKR